MASIITNKLKRSIAQSVFEDIFSRRSKYYYFFGKPKIGETIPSTPLLTPEYETETRNNIVAAKRIYSNDVAFVVPRYDWVSGSSYDKYSTQFTGEITNPPKRYYVYDPVNYRVYKCIDNNNGGASTVRPTSTEPFTFTTADNYKWKYLYTIPTSLRNKFLTANYIPVYTSIQQRYYADGGIGELTIVKSGSGYNQATTTITVTGDGTGADLEPVIYNGQLGGVIVKNAGRNYTRAIIEVVDSGSGSGAEIIAELSTGDIDSDQALVELLTTSGTVDSIEVLNGGTGYTNNSTVSIKGDGSGATAQLTLNNGVITSILVTNPGEGYTWAEAVVTPQSVPARTGSDVDVVSRVNVSPFLGHGRNAIDELNATSLMFFGSIFNDRLSDFDVNSAYKQYGILKDVRNFEFSSNVYDQVSKNRYLAEGDFGPKAIITGGGGSGAKASVVVTGKNVSGIFIEDEGSGFTSTPTVSLTGGGTIVTLNVTTTNASTTATVSSTATIYPGAVLVGNSNIASGTSISTITNGTTFVLSSAAVGSGTVSTQIHNPPLLVLSTSTVSGSKTLTTTDTTNLIIGTFVSNNANVPAGSFITSIINRTTFTINNNATGTGTVAQTYYTTLATASVTISGKLNQAGSTITNRGIGYSFAPSISLSGGGGNGGSYSTTISAGVGAIVINRQGSGYQSVPSVTISGLGGSGATATAEVYDGKVTKILVTNPGSWQINTVEVSTTSGSNTIATATDITGVVRVGDLITGNPNIPGGATVVSIGGVNTFTISANALATSILQQTSFTPQPTVSFSGGSPTVAATASVVMRNTLNSITVANEGSNYTSAPVATVNGSVGISAIDVLDIGEQFLEVIDQNTNTTSGSTTVTVTSTTGIVPGTVIFGNPNIPSGTKVTTVQNSTTLIISNAATGTASSVATSYNLPEIVISGGRGNGAKAVAYVDTSIRTIVLTNGGSGYTSAPVVNFSGTGGATAVANMSYIRNASGTIIGGSISSITVTKRGSGYDPLNPPTVLFDNTGTNGTGASAVAVVTRGIVSVNMTDTGTGYESAPVITVGASGSRKGFVLSPVLGRATVNSGIIGSIKTVSLTNSGLNYRSSPFVNLNGGGGSGAILYAKVVGTITGITINEPGTGYTTRPTINVIGGEGVGFSGLVNINNTTTGIQSVTVTNGGNNYVLTKFSMFTVGSILKDEANNEFSITATKTNNEEFTLVVASNAGFPVVNNMKLRKSGASDYFITKSALSQKFVESRFPTACYKITGTFDSNLFPINTVITLTDQLNGDKYFNIISTRPLGEGKHELLLQPTNGGDININNVLTNGNSFTVEAVAKPEIDVRTGDVLMISNNPVDFTQNQDQSLSFRTIINF